MRPSPAPLIPLALGILALAGCVAPGLGGPGDGWKPTPGEIRVPHLAEAPALDRVLSPGEWDDAVSLTGTFVIADGTKADGVYPFRLWVGANETMLFLAVHVTNTSPANPFSIEGVEWWPDVLDVFFLQGHEGPLTVPADLKSFTNFRDKGWGIRDGYWDGTTWGIQMEGPADATDSRIGYTNDSVFWETRIPRQTLNIEHDGVQWAPYAAFRMGVGFERQGPESPDSRGSFFLYSRDMFPGDGYTPHDYDDPATWLKLRMGA